VDMVDRDRSSPDNIDLLFGKIVVLAGVLKGRDIFVFRHMLNVWAQASGVGYPLSSVVAWCGPVGKW
jgi:hypothetical protein